MKSTRVLTEMGNTKNIYKNSTFILPTDYSQNFHQQSCLCNNKYLNLSVWTFNGFGSSKAKIIKQTGCKLFNNWFDCNDLICFLDTWRDPINLSCFNLNDHFSEYHEPGCKNHLGGRPSGDLSLLVRKSISK